MKPVPPVTKIFILLPPLGKKVIYDAVNSLYKSSLRFPYIIPLQDFMKSLHWS
jgi:hypothetical protein